MIRRRGIVLELSRHPIGYVTGEPVNRRHAAAWRQDVKDVHGQAPSDRDGLVFFQTLEEAAYVLDLAPRHTRDLDQGWTVRAIVDPWTIDVILGLT